jgi:NAD(P)-dependent dehydrogenase (short-subunit alcohol dehydrogenase family)
MDHLGRLNILVNCAALVGTSELPGWCVPFLEQSLDTFSAALEVNLTAAFRLVQACVPAIKESGHGSVIHISSTHGMVGPDLRLYEGTNMGCPGAYAASKGGLLQLTRWLATILAPGIRVNAVSPGGIERGQPEAFQKRYVARTPMARMGAEEDLKGAVVYLASDMSSYVTGQNLVVDGGWTTW